MTALAAVVSAPCPTCGGSGSDGSIEDDLPPTCDTCDGSGAVHPLIDWLVAEQSVVLVDALKRAGVLDDIGSVGEVLYPDMPTGDDSRLLQRLFVFRVVSTEGE